MSFGTSIGDIISLIQLAHQNYRNCKQAGGEYLEIAREVRSLHSVLKSLHDEAENKDSVLFQKDAPSKSQLSTTIEGCKGILEGIDTLLVKYHRLAQDTTETSKPKKLWHRMRFGAELDELGKFRWKIITYTSTLAVLLDSVHLKATNRVEKIAGQVEARVESGFAEVLDRLEGFEDMRRAVLYIATKARSAQRYNAMESVLSLSTYADDDKEVWRQFRSQLVSLGFRSDSLDRHMEVLKAYMMKLDQTGVLDDAVARTSASHQPWCGNASFRTTNLSLLGIIENDPSPIKEGDIQPPDSKTQSLQKEVTSSQVGIVKQDSTDGPEPATKEVDADVKQPETNLFPPTIAVHETLKDDSTQVSQSSTSIDKDPALPPIISSSGRRRISRATVEGGNDHVYTRRTDQDTILFGIEQRVFPAVGSPESDKPPAYSERSASLSSSLSQARDEARQPTTDFHFEPEKFHLVSDGFHSPDSAEANNKSKMELKGPSSFKVSRFSSNPRPRPPHPYAESYYSAAEAASSQSTLIASVTEFSESHSNLRVPRPQNRARPSSWDASDTRGSAARDAPRLTQIKRDEPQNSTTMGHTDIKPGPKSLDTGKRLGLPQGKAEGAERWLKWAENVPDKPAKVKWAEESPIRYQPSTRSSDDRKSRRNYRDNESKHRRASSEDDYNPDRFKPLRRRAHGDSDPKSSLSSDIWQMAAKAALIAGATEAFRVRKEPGGWAEVKGKRVLTAAIGAAGIDAAASQDPDRKNRRNILESVVGGLVANRLVNEERGRTRFRSAVVSEVSDSEDLDSDDRTRRSIPGVSYGSKPIPARPN